MEGIELVHLLLLFSITVKAQGCCSFLPGSQCCSQEPSLVVTGADRLLSLFLIDGKKLVVTFKKPFSAISLATLIALMIMLPFLVCFMSVPRAEAISKSAYS